MKTCKKALAIVLCLCMMLSVMVFSASAEDSTDKTVGMRLMSVEAVTKNGDPETVLQLKMDLSAYTDENGQPLATFTGVDKTKEIKIYEGLSLYLNGLVNELELAFSEDITEDDLDAFIANMDKSFIGTAKPVDFKDGILTVDVKSKDGADGTKMVSVAVKGLDALDKELDGELSKGFGMFVFDIPEGLLTAGDKVSEEFFGECLVDGLTPVTVEVPALIANIVNDIFNENYFGLITTGLMLLPFLFIVVPVLLNIIVAKANTVFQVYGINANEMVRDAWKVVKKFLPTLINEWIKGNL